MVPARWATGRGAPVTHKSIYTHKSATNFLIWAVVSSSRQCRRTVGKGTGYPFTVNIVTQSDPVSGPGNTKQTMPC